MVRGFLRSLADRDDEVGTVPRVRAYLEALGRPDMRYLVGVVRGAGAETVIRYGRAVLTAAGASVQVEGEPLDDPLLARAGTSVAAIAYQLAATRPDLGEISRHEAEVLLSLVAAAEASRRVVLLADDAFSAVRPIFGVAPDVVVVGSGPDDAVARAVAAVPDTKVAVLAPRDGSAIDAVEAAARARGVTLIVGGRDFAVEGAARPGGMTLTVGDERYTDLALGEADDQDLAATGIVAALALGAFGVRMRPEWVESGARLAAAREFTA